ncbi:preprotein translocase subunit SecY [Candidatus Marinimicrobia bacterium]|nr:preprotein translocase subunit SecY [Candidatus Neomarinimicrobiota bacterium]
MKKFLNIFSVPELRKKIGFTISLLFVYRLGGIVLVPGLNRDIVTQFMNSSEQSLFGIYNLFAGGFFTQFSIFALGIMPYISASIIIQLLGSVVPYFQRLQKEGPEGRKKITQLTRYGTLLIASVQAVGVCVLLTSYNVSGVQSTPQFLVSDPTTIFYLTTIIILVTGTMFVMWLGEQITNHGIGNGISLIIMVGILSRLPKVAIQQFTNLIFPNTPAEATNPFSFIISFILLIGIIVFVVLISTGIRKIPVSYAKRIVGRKMYGGQATHLPLRILTAGVMPIIFAQALVLIPSSLATLFPNSGFGRFLQNNFSDFTAIPYNIFLFVMIVGFTYFYTAVAFNPVDVADNMKKQGGFIPGVRPGKSTADFIDNILSKITLPAATFLGFIAILPNIIARFAEMDIATASFFGGTSILILVGVALDTLQQIESELLMRNYEGFLKTGKIKGRKRY